MKALQISAPGNVETVELPVPEAGTGEVLLRMEYVGFCGSDLNTYRGANAMAKSPVIPGHEIGAVIEAVGAGVPDFLKAGMNVTVNPYTACGTCPSCRRGRPNACRNNQTLGVQRDGAMREYMAVPWEKVIPAGTLSTRDSALVEPMSVGFHAVSRGSVIDTDTVMVIGCGMVGLGAVVRAALRGATVIAADIDDEKLLIAKQMGAKYGLNTMAPDFREQLAQVTGGDGPDVVVEAVGSPATYRLAVDSVAFTGRVVCIGYSKSDVTFETRLFVQKELDIRGSRNAEPSDFRAVIRYMDRGGCPAERLVSRIAGWSDAADALSFWNANPGKVFRILLKIGSGIVKNA
ncbi:MAG: zinc-binding alcohol dehydrogenase family protein [Bacteroidales bacterium]|nr:zinc-binding alcohol dehydrogenase family protein [Bacteroidales bacterium]